MLQNQPENYELKEQRTRPQKPWRKEATDPTEISKHVELAGIIYVSLVKRTGTTAEKAHSR